MDRYDALLEHLKLSQRHGLDAVANRLNDFVTELETLVENMKTSVQDAMPSDANELFPIKEIESDLAELRVEAAEAAEAPSQPSGVSLDNLRILDGAQSQSELLRALLPLLREHVGRTAVLVIRDGVVTAWSGMGFENSEAIRTWNGGIAASPSFSKLVDTGMPLLIDPAADPLVSRWLEGHGVAAEGALLPISLRGKLMGIVYVDHEGDQPWDLEPAQALVATACLLIDSLHNRSQVPSAMLAQIAPLEPIGVEPSLPEVSETPSEPQAETFEPEADHSAATAFDPTSEADTRESIEPVKETPTFEPPQAVKTEVQPPPVADAPAADDGGDFDYDFEPEPVSSEEAPAEETFDPSATIQVDVAEDAQVPAVEPALPQTFSPPSPVATTPPVVPPSVVNMETEAPPPVRPIEPPVTHPPVSPAPGTTAEDEARHEEARRFARLLVSEIKLYNEDEVDRGRVEKDLTVRLKEDIERSREMFEKRIPEEVRTGHNYFDDELVRILADGDADALGM
ncbi:MAG: hypothetical protein M3094_05220 [Actinomycetia bacterium]|nr:hypothetical protein [Actinomycetes bacterium]